MKFVHLFTICSAMALGSFVAIGCSDDSTSSPAAPDAGTTPTPTPPPNPPPPGADAGGNPAAPTLGAQIDRIGRPAMNTALNNAFEADATKSGPAKDAYNADTQASGWSAKYKAEFAKNLAILDSLDQNCGNQYFADNTKGADAYGTLAGVLADDRLWVNTGSTTCGQYLGVELNATGKVPNTDCGGRKLGYDVIDVTYTAAAGVDFGDTIAADGTKTGGAAFPYLASPQ